MGEAHGILWQSLAQTETKTIQDTLLRLTESELSDNYHGLIPRSLFKLCQ